MRINRGFSHFQAGYTARVASWLLILLCGGQAAAGIYWWQTRRPSAESLLPPGQRALMARISALEINLQDTLLALRQTRPPAPNVAARPPAAAPAPAPSPSSLVADNGDFHLRAPRIKEMPRPATPPGHVAAAGPPKSLHGSLAVLPAGKAIKDPLALKALDQALALREKGDMQGTLLQLREAGKRLPDHPVILYETGVTYQKMGLRQRAEQAWEKIYAMGEAGAGDYFAYADMELHPPSLAETAARGPSRMQMGNIQSFREILPGQNEKVTLRVPLTRSTKEEIDPSRLEIYVFFFDLVSGHRIEQTTSDQIEYRWAGDANWLGKDTETLDVIYLQPKPDHPAAGPLGAARAFYGYIARIYYDNELQDVVASPRTLMDYLPSGNDALPPSRESTPSPVADGPSNRLFPPTETPLSNK